MLIGRNMDQVKMGAAMESALVTTEELTAGPDLWVTFDDPFPKWDEEEEDEDAERYNAEEYIL